MLRAIRIVCVAAAAAAPSLPGRSWANEKETFTASNCAKCHSLSAVGIKSERTPTPGVEGPPDLSDVGNYHDAAFIESYLKKEVDNVPHADRSSTKRHPLKFAGSDADLKTLAEWLAKQKSAAK